MSGRAPRPRIVVGNWKMGPPSLAEAVELARAVAAIDAAPVSVGVAPPAVALGAVAEALRARGTAVYAQDVHWEAKGAYTGQTSAAMLRGLARGSIVGHSEVRRDQGDDDARVAAKARQALAQGLSVVFCLGESLGQRQAGETEAVLVRQVREGIGPLPIADLRPDRLAIAYEPIWAIGTGVPASGAQASEAVRVIRRELERLGADGEGIPVLYGGSVTAENAGEFAAAEGIDGALVGGASLKADDFRAICIAFR